MVLNIKEFKYHCPFCDNPLAWIGSKCFNVYCQGQEFSVDNLVIYRLNPELGIGRIIKKLEIPASKSLDDKDTLIDLKFKVLFDNNLTKILAPIDLIHIIFSTNDRIITEKGIGVVNSKDFHLNNGKISYEVLYSDANLHQVEEKEILSIYHKSLKKAIEQQQIDNPEYFLIKYWANLFHSYYTSYQIKCITNSRLSLMPHQINVAHRLSEDYFPRVILADEVGLGKTIEAGIYIKEMMARNLADRILIIVPATLVRQWQFELSNKFNIDFTIYDGKKTKELLKKGSHKKPKLLQNPFYYDNLIICSLQFARNPKYAELLTHISWDIAIFDEAHHLRRYVTNLSTGKYRETLNYVLGRKISENCESLLLLTATPLQLHSFDLYSLIELIQGEAFENFSDFEHFRKNMPYISLLITNVNKIERLNNFELKNTIKLLRDLHYVDKRQEDSKTLTLLKNEIFKTNLLKKIEKDHTLSKFLIRNRKKNVFFDEFLNERIVKTIMVHPTMQELEIYNEIRLYLAKIYNSSISKANAGIGFIITTLQKLLTSSKHAFLRSIERRLEQIERSKSLISQIDDLIEEEPEYFESEFEDEYLDSDVINSFGKSRKKKKESPALDLVNQEKMLKDFYDRLNVIPYDSKFEKLLELMNHIHVQNDREKVLIFTQFVDTLFYMKKLLEKQGYQVETFYGGMNKEQKDRAVEFFKNSDKFVVLLSTEIGGEGRNFQFCRILINYDLPWNPMKLEQRIGRLDRIGQQSKEIYIYNFFLEDTIETDIIFVLDKRIHLFNESIGQLEPIIGNIEKDLKNLIFTTETEKRRKLNEFTRKLDIEVKKAKEIEMQLDDFMIDKKSFKVDDLITSVAACEEVKLSHNELFLLLIYFFNLEDNRYGSIITNDGDKKDLKLKNEVNIQLSNKILKNPKYKFKSDHYSGTFDLDLAREREEIDFFALGHPLINNILEFCISRVFKGRFSVLQVKKSQIPKQLITKFEGVNELYLFLFVVKFQGYITEKQIIGIIIDKSGNEIEGLSEFILDIDNFNDIFNFQIGLESKIYVHADNVNELREKAKNKVKWKTSQWKSEIKELNNKIFNKEKNKKQQIHRYKLSMLNFKLESLKVKLEKKKTQLPSKRQMQNIHNMGDEGQKQERLRKTKLVEEDIVFLNNDIIIAKRNLDDLEFHYQDLQKDMQKRNLAKFYTNVDAFAVIRFDS
ncbi:MAG: DEAD/DEAH box helicase [Promethearchaeota archaeon]